MARLPSVVTALVTCVSLFVSASAWAALYRVGLGGGVNGCTHSTLQAAINTAKLNDGPDRIHLIQGMTDAEQALTIEGQDLTIVGGYENCLDTDVVLERTAVSGAEGLASSVFTIRGPGVVRLENLHILHGDATGNGGGIWYQGSSVANSVNALFLTRTFVDENYADGSGGGVHFVSSGGQLAELILEEDTGLFRNGAGSNGGGIHLAGNTRLLARGHRLFFWNNTARGNGGALHVLQPAQADIGSGMWAGEATFKQNLAGSDGGAIHVFAPDPNSEVSTVRLYGLVSDQPLTMRHNNANRYGGAISAHGFDDPRGRLAARVCVRDLNVQQNTALDGAALRLTNAEYGYCSGVSFDDLPVSPCAPRWLCNRYEGNQTESAGQSDQEISIIRMFHGALDLRDAKIAGNEASRHLMLIEDWIGFGSTATIVNSVIVGNRLFSPTVRTLGLGAQATVDVIHTSFGPRLRTEAETLSGVFGRLEEAPPAALTIRNSIVFDPGSFPILLVSQEPVTIDHVMFDRHPGGHADNPTLVVADPRFTANDDLRLRPDSPAIDFAPADTGRFLPDIEGNPRPVDLQIVPNLGGPADLGAYELQSIEPDGLFGNGFER